MPSIFKHSGNLIAIEVLIGVGLSVVFIIVTFNLDKEFWGDNYVTGLLRFYGGMSAIFFLSVFSVGIIDAVISKKSRRIPFAVMCAIAFWLLSLIITAVSIDFLRLFSAYFMLVGITYGFNYGLKRNAVKEIGNSIS